MLGLQVNEGGNLMTPYSEKMFQNDMETLRQCLISDIVHGKTGSFKSACVLAESVKELAFYRALGKPGDKIDFSFPAATEFLSKRQRFKKDESKRFTDKAIKEYVVAALEDFNGNSHGSIRISHEMFSDSALYAVYRDVLPTTNRLPILERERRKHRGYPANARFIGARPEVILALLDYLCQGGSYGVYHSDLRGMDDLAIFRPSTSRFVPTVVKDILNSKSKSEHQDSTGLPYASLHYLLHKHCKDGNWRNAFDIIERTLPVSNFNSRSHGYSSWVCGVPVDKFISILEDYNIFDLAYEEDDTENSPYIGLIINGYVTVSILIVPNELFYPAANRGITIKDCKESIRAISLSFNWEDSKGAKEIQFDEGAPVVFSFSSRTKAIGEKITLFEFLLSELKVILRAYFIAELMEFVGMKKESKALFTRIAKGEI